MCHSFLVCRVSVEKSANNLKRIPLYAISYFSLVAFNILSLSLAFVVLITMCLGVFLLGFILLRTLCFLHLVDYFLSHVRKVFTYFFKYFLVSLLSSPAGTCIMVILVSLMLFQRSLRLSSFFFYILFCDSDSHQSILQITYLFFCISYSAIDSFQCIVHLFVCSLIITGLW